MAEPHLSISFKTPSVEEEMVVSETIRAETERRLRLFEARIAEWERKSQVRQVGEFNWC